MKQKFSSCKRKRIIAAVKLCSVETGLYKELPVNALQKTKLSLLKKAGNTDFSVFLM